MGLLDSHAIKPKNDRAHSQTTSFPKREPFRLFAIQVAMDMHTLPALRAIGVHADPLEIELISALMAGEPTSNAHCC